MIKKIKNILGIEGIKLSLEVPEEVQLSSSAVVGTIVISTKSEKTITGINLTLIEKYKRGRSEERLINKYVLGSIQLESHLKVTPERIEKIDFTLPFNLMLSEMDQLEKDNFLLKPFVKLAKKLKNVQSEYKLEVIAFVKETKLNAIAKKNITLV